jgi:3-oxoadipate enol-lactonase
MNVPYLERDTAKIYYEENGEGEVIVLLHSLGTSSKLWERQIEYFQNRYRLISVDARGHGKTMSQSPFSIKECALDALAVMDHLNIKSAHFVGISMGGHMAMELSASHPNRIRSLSLCDTFYQIPAEVREDRIHSRFELMEKDDFILNWAKLSLQQEASFELVDFTCTLYSCTKESYKEAWVAVMNVDYEFVLTNIRIPTMVLVGDHDLSAPVKVSQSIHQMIPNSRLCIIEDAGHLSNLSAPETFNKEISDFLASL